MLQNLENIIEKMLVLVLGRDDAIVQRAEANDALAKKIKEVAEADVAQIVLADQIALVQSLASGLNASNVAQFVEEVTKLSAANGTALIEVDEAIAAAQAAVDEEAQATLSEEQVSAKLAEIQTDVAALTP